MATYPFGLVSQKHPLKESSDDVCRRHMKQNFIFASYFSRAHFPFAMKKNQNVLPERPFQWEKSWEGRAKLGTLVGLLLATTRLAASAMLELSSPASSSWCGLCRQPDCDPHWLGTHALAPRVCSWDDQGRKPNSAASSAWGSLKKKLRRQWLACSNDRWLVFGSQEGLLAATKKWPIPHQKVLEKWQLVGILVLEGCSLAVVLVEPLLKVALWIHNVVGHLACQATRMNK
jgi:hypothetical protein